MASGCVSSKLQYDIYIPLVFYHIHLHAQFTLYAIIRLVSVVAPGRSTQEHVINFVVVGWLQLVSQPGLFAAGEWWVQVIYKKK